MAIDATIRQRAEELVGAVLLAVAIGGGWYLVDEARVPGDLDFIEVGWWNIRDFSSASRDQLEIEQIAQVIRDLDVVAIGELNDRDALSLLTQELGPSWEWAATESKIGRTPGSAEHYGFVWNSDTVQIVGDVHVDPDPGDGFDREPAWATFTTLAAGLDFTVIAVHITWGSAVAGRKAEIRELPDVWGRVQEATVDDDDLVLVGDFNRNIGDDSFEPLLAIPGMTRANQETGPTHISSTTTYDQVFISLDSTQEWTGEYQTIAFDDDVFDGDDAAAKLAGSDHRPVWIRLLAAPMDDD